MRARLIKTGEKIIKLALADANLSLNYLSDRVRSFSTNETKPGPRHVITSNETSNLIKITKPD